MMCEILSWTPLRPDGSKRAGVVQAVVGGEVCYFILRRRLRDYQREWYVTPGLDRMEHPLSDDVVSAFRRWAMTWPSRRFIAQQMYGERRGINTYLCPWCAGLHHHGRGEGPRGSHCSLLADLQPPDYIVRDSRQRDWERAAHRVWAIGRLPFDGRWARLDVVASVLDYFHYRPDRLNAVHPYDLFAAPHLAALDKEAI